MTWKPAAGVLECRDSDLTVLMSLDTGEYHTLDETAGRLWRQLRESPRSVSDMTAMLVASFAMSRGSAKSDVEAWLDAMAARQLVEPATGRAGITSGVRRALQVTSRVLVRPTVRPSLPRCLLALAFVRASLKSAGLRSTLRTLYSTPASGAHVPEDSVKHIVRTIVRAGALCPFKAQCLEQSLCIAWWLRALGADAHVRMGALPYPFKAHAWAECDGVPLNETTESLKLYRPFGSISRENL